MSISLTALPPELVECVVANIVSQPSLYNLARSSRQLYICTIPHLYHHVTIQEGICRRGQPHGQLRNLTSSLIRRPDLAGLVRHFTYDVRFSEEHKSKESHNLKDFAEPVSPTTPVNVDQAFKTVVNALSSSKEEANSWLRELSLTHKCHHDALLALLLSVLLKVEKLVLNLEVSSGTHYLERMIRRAACRESPFDIQPPFEALTVFMHSHNMSNSRSTGFIASLLRPPAIQEISGSFRKTWAEDLGDDKVRDTTLIEFDSFSSPLTSLDIAVHALNTVDLEHMLRAPKALKTLFYHRAFAQASMNFTDIRHALESQKHCLESLGFDYDDKFANHVRLDRLEEGPMTSFIGFPTLKVFKTAARFLNSTDNGTGRHSLINIFPPSLETLHLTRFQPFFESLLDAIEHLLENKSPQQITLLKKLILEEAEPSDLSLVVRPARLMDVLWRGTQETTIGRLSRVAAAQGVSLDVIEESREEWNLRVVRPRWERNRKEGPWKGSWKEGLWKICGLLPLA